MLAESDLTKRRTLYYQCIFNRSRIGQHEFRRERVPVHGRAGGRELGQDGEGEE